jgi:tetratricopeptide (TPR) repeat protein
MKKENERIRDQRLLEIVRGLLLSEVAFQEIFKKYKQRRLRFSDIEHWVDDKGQNLFYGLKEQCHSLFRNTAKRPVQKNEWLLDLAIGSIFHEAMKLRENIYQLEVYRPKYVEYKTTLRLSGSKVKPRSSSKEGIEPFAFTLIGSKGGKSAYERDYLQQFERIIAKAKEAVAEGMDETRSLFQDAMAQLVDFFRGHSKNPILVRFLLENQGLLLRVYGSQKAQEIFTSVFKNGFLEAYEVAGRSYLQSEHYDLASEYLLKAIKMAPYRLDLSFLLVFSLGMDAYYNDAYSKALAYFEKLPSLWPKNEVPLEYLKKVEHTCARICVELKEEKRRKTFLMACSIADEIKKML